MYQTFPPIIVGAQPSGYCIAPDQKHIYPANFEEEVSYKAN